MPSPKRALLTVRSGAVRLCLAECRERVAQAAPLSFVRFEPYVLAKRSLTGDTTERVDTRVLQAIYTFVPNEFPAFIGQQVDVFIAAPTREDATRTPTSGQVAFGAIADNSTRTAGAATRTAFATSDERQ
jgi:hypothetical protein